MLVLAVGVAASMLVWDHSRERERSLVESAFLAETDRLVAVIERQLNTYAVVMRGLQGFFQGSREVEYHEFLAYTRALHATSDVAGLQGVAWVELVRREQLAAHEARVRSQLPVNYSIHPGTEGDVLAPIIFMEPLAGDNLAAIGLDIYQVPRAREAAERARDSGEIVITRPIGLVQDTLRAPSPSFVMYLPVYAAGSTPDTVATRREQIVGFVDIPFRVADLMAGLRNEINWSIDLDIYDGDPADPANTLFTTDAVSHAERLQAGELQRRQTLTVGTRSWALLLSTTPEYRAATVVPGQSLLVLLAGGSASFALALLVLVLARGRDRSEQRAARLSNLYHALSEVNQAIVRMDSEQELMPLVCRMAVEFGGMKMAWVGRVDTASGLITRAASAGEGCDYLDSLVLSARLEHPDSSGPTGTAVRENRPVIVNDYLESALTRPWQERARKYGWRSAAAFPIQRGGRQFAVLNVYHHRPDAFDEDAINLLREMATDISFALDNFDREAQRTKFQKAVRESEALLSTILENVGACIYLKDLDGKYLFVNQQVLDLWGVERQEVIGFGDDKFFDERTLARVREYDNKVLNSGQAEEQEEVDTVFNGKTVIFWSVKIPLRDAEGKIYALCGISTDITEHHDNRERIRVLSNYDSLTGLPNRELLREKARIALNAARAGGGEVALLYIDVDRFQIINDSLGLAVGDTVLKELSKRLTAELSLEATLCRSGGDEFFLLLPNTDAEQAVAMAERLLELVAEPLQAGRHRLNLTASIGVACFPGHGRDLDQLSQSADAALSRAKRAGRNTYSLFVEEMRARANETLLIESELRDALANQGLSLHYQPQVSFATDEITGVEALLRWQHPEIGYISPARFIPIAEESGLILEIGNWVLRTAIAQQASWRAAGLPVLSVAVNLSAVQMYRDDFTEMVCGLLAEYDLPPHMLDLELTERIAMENSGKTLATLSDLHGRGVVLSIDDFGTGYSSLSYLKRYPVQKLKIDKSFVDGLADDPEDQAIVLAIIGIARGLGFGTVAEGVETLEQWQFLQQHGCNEYQGYYFSKPLPPGELEKLARGRGASEAGR
ncbi:EAL domain-containing protein [Haliea sp. E1-2-M8]|uniref:bifunctional diguanylate cyclase/phosphodiesterase n=1 Tax=Haliea sp. E1-2-M8 TaxID=3064706 RepID=UPI00271FE1BC|nr:EAL domain-containing protein [Haliea sp. E1-2-M8]MDO8860588.1 EAL domain-containing protein [Haliea sp. E1-2-M8]